MGMNFNSDPFNIILWALVDQLFLSQGRGTPCKGHRQNHTQAHGHGDTQVHRHRQTHTGTQGQRERERGKKRQTHRDKPHTHTGTGTHHIHTDTSTHARHTNKDTHTHTHIVGLSLEVGCGPFGFPPKQPLTTCPNKQNTKGLPKQYQIQKVPHPTKKHRKSPPPKTKGPRVASKKANNKAL